MDKMWLDGLPLHPPDEAIPVRVDGSSNPVSIGDPIPVDRDGRLVGEIEAGSYELIWRHSPPPA